MSKYRIEFEFEYTNTSKHSTEDDVISCIEEDVPVAIQNAMGNITSNIEYGEFKIVKEE